MIPAVVTGVSFVAFFSMVGVSSVALLTMAGASLVAFFSMVGASPIALVVSDSQNGSIAAREDETSDVMRDGDAVGVNGTVMPEAQ